MTPAALESGAAPPRASSPEASRAGACLFLASSAAYLAPTLLVASTKRLWNDELFTYYIGARPGMEEVWSALATGAEQLPPPFFALTRLFFHWFGPSELALRLPEVLGFWLMGTCLFWYVARYTSAVWGSMAMLFPMATAAYGYAFEARPYALVCGFAALSLMCWRSAAGGRRRGLALTGLALSLAAAVSSHYYAVLVFVPLGLGEAARTLRERRADLPVWAALAAGLAPLAAFLPLIRAARTYAGTFWAKPRWSDVAAFHDFLFWPAATGLATLLLVGAILVLAGPGGRPRTRLSLPLHEMAALLGYVTIPVCGVILAKAATGAFTYRYALPAIIGWSIAIAIAFCLLLDGRRGAGAALALLLMAIAVFGGWREYTSARAAARHQRATIRHLRWHSGARPLVIADPHLFFELSHYAPRDLASRLVYLADPAIALRRVGTDTVDRGLIANSRWAPLNVQDYRRFTASGQAFMVYGHPATWAWLVPELKSAGRQIAIENSAHRMLLVVKAGAGE